MDLFERVSEDIKNAMKAKDKVALETLRNVKKFFLEAKTAPGANDTLTDDAALKIIQKLVKQGKDSAEIYIGQGRQDLAEGELAQVRVMEAYLPKQMTPEELEAINIMRKALNGLKPDEATDRILDMFAHTRNNVEFVNMVKKNHFI